MECHPFFRNWNPPLNQHQKSKTDHVSTHITININHLYIASITSAHGILLCPAASSGFIFGSVSLVHMGNLRYKRIIRIWISQQWANGEQYLMCIQVYDYASNKYMIMHPMISSNKSFLDYGSMKKSIETFVLVSEWNWKPRAHPTHWTTLLWQHW
jgi:hypothetical protein